MPRLIVDPNSTWTWIMGGKPSNPLEETAHTLMHHVQEQRQHWRYLAAQLDPRTEGKLLAKIAKVDAFLEDVLSELRKLSDQRDIRPF